MLSAENIKLRPFGRTWRR